MEFEVPKYNPWRFSRQSTKLIQKITSINPDTGEYTEKKRYVDNLYSRKGYVMNYNNDYIKMFKRKDLPAECTIMDCGKFYKLTKYLVGNNQLLGYSSDKLKPLTVEKIAQILECGERQARKFLKKMKDLKIMKEVLIDGVSWYAINPIYALKGKYLSLRAYVIFQHELSPVLPEWVVRCFLSEKSQMTDKIEIKE